MIQTGIDVLDIRFQPIATAVCEVMASYVIPVRFNGYKMRVMETRRDANRQKQVFADGASKNKIGWHNFGLAVDVGFFEPEKGKYLGDDSTGIYRALGFVAMSFGCRWGGNWDGDTIINEPGENDLGHFEYHPRDEHGRKLTLDEMIKIAGMVA